MNEYDYKIGNTTIRYRVRPSTRAKRLRLEVTPGNIVVVAPADIATNSPDTITTFLHAHREQILAAIHDIKRPKANHKIPEQSWQSGAKIMYRGRNIMLNITPAPVDHVTIHYRSRFDVQIPQDLSATKRPAALRHAFNAYFRSRALRDARKYCTHYAQQLHQPVTHIELFDHQQMWGTCTRDQILRIHWRLIQAPKIALQYVCAHETAHLLHRHHDDDFWQTLSTIMPEWREAKQRLEDWERNTFEHRREL